MPTLRAEARLESNEFDTSALQVHRVLGREAISQLYRFEIDFIALERAPLPLRDLVGAEASLVFEVEGEEGEEARTVHGMIAEATDLLTSEPGYRSYRIALVPRMHRLALVEFQDVFLRKSVPAVLAQKLSLVGLGGHDVETRLEGAYPEREIVVEYKETDLAFVSRLAEHLGISFFFRDDDGRDQVVFTDHDAGFGLVRADGKVPFHARGEQAGVYALEETARVMPRSFAVKDYNYATPLLNVSGRHTSPVGLAGGVVEYAPNAATPGECDKLAEIRAQERAALHNFFQGESTLFAFHAGLRFTLEGHPGLDGDKELLLVEVTHHFSQPVTLHGAPAEPSYHNTFRAVAAGRSYRPPRVTPKPRIFGLLTAVVEPGPEGVGKHADVDEVGRYTVRFHFDLTPLGERQRSSLPVRMIQPHAGTGYGMHFPLHPGVEVAIAFEDGDPDRPLIVGAVPNAVTASPVTRANAGMSRIQTATGIRVTLRDHL
jgi:type VI secretion system secreted protein VgrG